MRQIWFTSDLHFGHANIIKEDYSNRPFDSLEEMEEGLISNWNEVVNPKDTVYVLGDIAYGRGAKSPEHYLGQLHGHKFVIRGNHDPKRDIKGCGWTRDVYMLKAGGARLWLSHYAHARWPGSHKGTIHLFGHSHGDFEGLGKSMDVGVDAQGYYPIDLDTVLAVMETQGVTGHHGTNR